MMPAPEHSHGAHGHGTGMKWLDIVVAVSAVFISVVSLVVSIEHGRTMEKMVDQNQKMVEAATLPLLTSEIDTSPDPAKGYVRLSINNSGVGPAIIDRFEIRYKGRSYSELGPLLQACCAAGFAIGEKKFTASTSSVSGSALPAREHIVALDIPLADHPKLLPLLAEAKAQIELNACYCSVLDQCWETGFKGARPHPVSECKPAETPWLVPADSSRAQLQ